MVKLRKISILILLLPILFLLISCDSNTTDTTIVTTITKNNFTYNIYYTNSSDYYYATISEYTGSETNLVIADTINYDSKDVVVTTICRTTFAYNNPIETITIGKNIETIEPRTFMNFKNLKTVILNDKIELLDMFLFSRSTIETITIPENVKKISSATFSKSSLKEIIILNNNIEISAEAFDNCDSLTTVYFKGSAEDFSNLNVKEYNDNFINSKIYYYSEEIPNELNTYWHFVDNKVTIW